MRGSRLLCRVLTASAFIGVDYARQDHYEALDTYRQLEEGLCANNWGMGRKISFLSHTLTITMYRKQPGASSSKNNPAPQRNNPPPMHLVANRGYRLHFDLTPSVSTRKISFVEDQAIVAHDPSAPQQLKYSLIAENARTQQLVLDLVNSEHELFQRPIIRVTNGIPFYAAATSFHEYNFSAPICIIHGRNPFRSIEECRLVQKTRGRQQIFACPVPNCEIYFIIPNADVARQQFIASQQAEQRRAVTNDVEGNEAPDAHIEEVESADEHSPPPPPPTSKGKGKQKARASSVIIISDDDEAPAPKKSKRNKPPAGRKPKHEAEDRDASPQQLPLRFQLTRPPIGKDEHASLFEEDAAFARYSFNAYIVQDVETKFKADDYNDNPTEHPTASNFAHRLLEIYDRLSVPESFLDRYYGRYVLDTNLGENIIRLNSCVGITSDAQLVMHENNIECRVCLAQFSIMGYNSHITERGCCGNWPQPKKVAHAELDEDLLQFPLRTFPRDFLVRDNKPMYESLQRLSSDPVSVAWSAWHSRVGIPKDVFALIKTGAIKCAECEYVRSVKFHLEHLDDHDECTDPGEDRECLIKK